MFSSQEARATLDASLSLVKEALLKSQRTTEDCRNLIKQVIGVYLESVRINQGPDDMESEKVSHSAQVVYSSLNNWVVQTIGRSFGENKFSRWSLPQAEVEIKVHRAEGD